MDKLKMHTPNLTQDNIARIAELFPGCVVEVKDEGRGMKDENLSASFRLPDSSLRYVIDFDLLRQELSEHIVEGPQERYHLNWPGKREALLTANAPIAKTLRPVRDESVDFDTTKNLFIEGDNLDALKLLQETYLGKVKMIYIDPPYNTGNDFIYEDDFAEDAGEYLRRSNQVDEKGNRLVANTAANGRFHSDWLSMMYARLKLARNLLKDDGIVFISIDDNEASNLKICCDQVFGEQNHLVTIYVQVRYPGKTLAEKNDYQKLIEQVVVYQKKQFTPIKEVEDYSINGFCWQINEISSGKKQVIGGKQVEVFLPGQFEILKTQPSVSALKETWATGSVLKVNASGKFFGTHLAPRKETDGLGVLYKVEGIGEDGLGFRYFTGPQRESASKGKFFSGVPLHRRQEISDGFSIKEKPILNFYDFADSFGNCRHEGGVDFRSGKKPVQFLKTLLKFSVNSKENDIILDFFAGSSTTADAVMQLNAEDGGNRKFIMVQLPEPCDEKSEAYKAGYKTIAEISKERIRRAGTRIKDELAENAEGGRQKEVNGNSLFSNSEIHPSSFIHHPSLDTGFRVLKIDTSNMADVYYTPDALGQANLDLFIDNIKPDRTAEDLLFQVMLDWGVDLTLPISKEIIKVNKDEGGRMDGKDEGGRMDGKDEGGRMKDEQNVGADSAFRLQLSSFSIPPSSFRLPNSSFKEYEVFFVDGNALAACFDAHSGVDEAFVKELATHKPLRVVFRDAGFRDSAVKINVEQIFKLLSPATDVKCI